MENELPGTCTICHWISKNRKGQPAIKTENIAIGPLKPEDGFSVNQLVANSPPLDQNSLYCNLLQCSHFAATSAGAWRNDQLLGHISGYLVPGEINTLFVWQVAVSAAARGEGLATRMLLDILGRPACRNVNHLQTTVTASNQASKALFYSLANRLDAVVNENILFDHNKHFRGAHDSEILLTIGPFLSSAK